MWTSVAVKTWTRSSRLWILSSLKIWLLNSAACNKAFSAWLRNWTKRMSWLCWITASTLWRQMISKTSKKWLNQWWKAAMILTFSLHTESRLAGKSTTVMKKYTSWINWMKNSRIDYFSRAFQGQSTKMRWVNSSKKKRVSMISPNIRSLSFWTAILKLSVWPLLCYQIGAFLSYTICC